MLSGVKLSPEKQARGKKGGDTDPYTDPYHAREIKGGVGRVSAVKGDTADIGTGTVIDSAEGSLSDISSSIGANDGSKLPVLTVAESDLVKYTALIGSCRHPSKGQILFALRDITAGEVIAEEPLSSIAPRFFPSMQVLRDHLEKEVEPKDRNEYLQHCCPAGDGTVCEQSTAHFNAFFSHSSSPNCFQDCDRFTKAKVTIEATRAIARGDELTVDYDSSVGYERHGNEALVRDFLALCADYGVEKRPSRLTLPPLRVELDLGSSPHSTAHGTAVGGTGGDTDPYRDPHHAREMKGGLPEAVPASEASARVTEKRNSDEEDTDPYMVRTEEDTDPYTARTEEEVSEEGLMRHMFRHGGSSGAPHRSGGVGDDTGGKVKGGEGADDTEEETDPYTDREMDGVAASLDTLNALTNEISQGPPPSQPSIRIRIRSVLYGSVYGPYNGACVCLHRPLTQHSSPGLPVVPCPTQAEIRPS